MTPFSLVGGRRNLASGRIDSRGRRLRLESLETRQMLSYSPPVPFDGEVMLKSNMESNGVEFKFAVDPALDKSYPLLETNLQIAGKILSDLLAGAGCIDVLVKAGDASQFTDEIVAWTMGPESSYPVTSTVWEPGTLYEARTGYDLNVADPDIIIQFSTQFLATDAWFDPSNAPESVSVPAAKVDVVSVAMHELLHGLGFYGNRTTTPGNSWGKFLQGTMSTFDSLTEFGAGGGFADSLNGLSGSNENILYFNGAEATQVYGGPVPLGSMPQGIANFYHVGNIMGEGKSLAGDLMSGMILVTGDRTLPSGLDLAILHDLGWQQTSWTPARPMIHLPSLEVMSPLRPPIPEADYRSVALDVSLRSFDTFATTMVSAVPEQTEYVNWTGRYDAAIQSLAVDSVRTLWIADQPELTSRIAESFATLFGSSPAETARQADAYTRAVDLLVGQTADLLPDVMPLTNAHYLG